MATRRSRSRADQADELNLAEMEGLAGSGLIEWDPNAAESATAGMEIQSATEDVGVQSVSDDFFRARDEIMAMIGGDQIMAASIQQAESGSDLGVSNICGIGVGLKSSAGSCTGDVSVKVFVREKLPVSRLSADLMIPSSVAGLPTDVEESGELVASSFSGRYPRPVPCGVSCGHVSVTAGTLGCLVVLNNNRLCILSNNHVLANENNALIGDSIIQPGRVDGGRMPADQIGVLERFVPISFAGANSVDAAAAWTSSQLTSSKHVTYQMNPTPVSPALSMGVIKNGRTTQATQGVITAIGVNNVRVRYTAGVALFNNQVFIQGIGSRPFSQGGDSGSVIVSAGTRQPVALLFAGSASHTIANPIASVVSALGISRFIGG